MAFRESERFAELTKQYMEPESPCSTKAGEIMAAANRIVYRYLNDGDMVGVGWGKMSCNAAYRFLRDVAHVLDSDYPEDPNDFAYEHQGSSAYYEDFLEDLQAAVEDYIDGESESPLRWTDDALFAKGNRTSYLDYTEPEDYEDDEDGEVEESASKGPQDVREADLRSAIEDRDLEDMFDVLINDKGEFVVFNIETGSAYGTISASGRDFVATREPIEKYGYGSLEKEFGLFDNASAWLLDRIIDGIYGEDESCSEEAKAPTAKSIAGKVRDVFRGEDGFEVAEILNGPAARILFDKEWVALVGYDEGKGQYYIKDYTRKGKVGWHDGLEAALDAAKGIVCGKAAEAVDGSREALAGELEDALNHNAGEGETWVTAADDETPGLVVECQFGHRPDLTGLKEALADAMESCGYGWGSWKIEDDLVELSVPGTWSALISLR